MKKILFLASALVGFAGVASAQEVGTVKTTTVQYQAPTCTNCRTTTEVRTVYPEVKQYVAMPAVAEAEPVQDSQKKLTVTCKENNDLPIRNPLFVLGQGKFSVQEAANGYKEPSRKVGVRADGETIKSLEYVGWDAHMRVAYGITDRWSLQVWGGKQYSRPKTSNYRAATNGIGPVPHTSAYDVSLGSYYHLLDFCYLDLIVGVEANWHRHKVKQGERVVRDNGWGWAPTATIGSNIGWFTPYFTFAYQFDHTKLHEDPSREGDKSKHWKDSHGYYYDVGVYMQPSKWWALNFHIQKIERAKLKPQWTLGVDFYPYKNVVVGIEANTRRPYDDPMYMYGAAAFAKIVF